MADGIQRRSPRRTALALTVYLVAAILLAAGHALGHFGSVCACADTTDPSASMWFLRWWPHAIGAGLDPLFTHVVWWPSGVNAAQATGMPSAALLAYPVTALAGMLVSYNALAIAAPLLAAFSAFLLCRRVTRSYAGALAGGFLFGFSSFEFAQLTTHLNDALMFPVPLLVLTALRRSLDDIRRGRCVVETTVLVLLLEGLSAELLLDAAVLGGLAFGVAWLSVRGAERERVQHAVVEMVLGGVVAGVISLPFLRASLHGGGPTLFALPQRYGIDLLNLVVPTQATALGGSAFTGVSSRFSRGNLAEAGGYLSIALVAAFLLWLGAAGRRSLTGRLCGSVCLVSMVLAFGSHLQVDGRDLIPLPWDVLERLPILKLIVPARLMVFAWLAVAVGVAQWVGQPAVGGRVRWAVALLAIVLTLPNPSAALHGARLSNPSFFAGRAYRRYLAPGSVVLAFPFANLGQSMLWQAETGFYFRMPAGYVGIEIPASLARLRVVNDLFTGRTPAAAALRCFLRAHAVSAVVLDTSESGRYAGIIHLLEGLGLKPRTIDGVLLFGGRGRAWVKPAGPARPGCAPPSSPA